MTKVFAHSSFRKVLHSFLAIVLIVGMAPHFERVAFAQPEGDEPVDEVQDEIQDEVLDEVALEAEFGLSVHYVDETAQGNMGALVADTLSADQQEYPAITAYGGSLQFAPLLAVSDNQGGYEELFVGDLAEWYLEDPQDESLVSIDERSGLVSATGAGDGDVVIVCSLDSSDLYEIAPGYEEYSYPDSLDVRFAISLEGQHAMLMQEVQILASNGEPFDPEATTLVLQEVVGEGGTTSVDPYAFQASAYVWDSEYQDTRVFTCTPESGLNAQSAGMLSDLTWSVEGEGASIGPDGVLSMGEAREATVICEALDPTGASVVDSVHVQVEAVPEVELEPQAGEGEPNSGTSSVTRGGTLPDDANLQAAMQHFGIPETNVFCYQGTKMETAVFRDVSAAVTAEGAPMILFVPSGTHDVGTRLKIPENVVLVSSEGATYFYTNEDYTGSGDVLNDHMISVTGSVYGGTFDGNNLAISVIRFADTAFGGVNGQVLNATAIHGAKNGICARGPSTSGVQIFGCTATDNYENGITIERDSHCAIISNTTSVNNGAGFTQDNPDEPSGSGINISHSDVDVIESCVLIGNADKGISTNSDPREGLEFNKPGCAIQSVTGCTISGNVLHGVYIKPKCSIGVFSGNTVTGNGDGLTCSGKTLAGTTGPSTVSVVENNTFSGNDRSQVTAGDVGAQIELGVGNQIIDGHDNGVLAKDGGKVIVSGNGIVIRNNLGAGVSSTTGSEITISGNGTSIEGNKDGIYVKGATLDVTAASTTVKSNTKTGVYVAEGTASLKNTTISGNTGDNVYLVNGASVTLGEKNLISSGKTNGIYVAGSTLNVTGTWNVVKSNARAGVSLGSGGKMNVTGANTKITANSGDGVYIKNGALSVTAATTTVESNAKTGIYMAGGTATLKNTAITANTGDNVLVAGDATLTLQDNNSVTSGKSNGIYTVGATLKITGANNKVNSNAKAGISLGKSGIASISGKGTLVQSNKADGITVKGGTLNATAAVTTVKANAKTGLYMAGGTATLKNTAITANTGDNVSLSGAATLTLGDKNTITSGKSNGIYAAGATIKVTGVGNVVQSNTKAGISLGKDGKAVISGKGTVVQFNKADGISVKGGNLTVTAAATTVKANAKTGIYMVGGTATLKNTTITANTGDNVSLSSAATLTLGDKNTVSAGKSNGIYVVGSTLKVTGVSNVIGGTSATKNCNAKAGISLGKGGKAAISGKGTLVQFNKADGISVNGGSLTVTAASTTVKSNAKTGLYMTSGTATLKNTTITANTGDNVSLTNGATLTLGDKNLVSSGKSNGIYVGGATLKVTGVWNTVKANAKAGISLGKSANMSVTGANTKVISNKGDGIYVNASTLNITSSGKTYVQSNMKAGIYTVNLKSGAAKNMVFSGNKGKNVYTKSGKTLKVS